MQYISHNGIDFSRFQLGTVQLGMDYGLGDHTAKPTKEYAFSLLDLALSRGVNTLDTANNYGESQKVIGAWLRTVPAEKRPFLITKIGPFDHSSDAALRADIRRQTEGCLRDLGVEKLDMLMVHNFEDYERSPETVRETFLEMKKEGLIAMTGISAYSRHDYKQIAASRFDAVQIPLNVFDWGRIDDGGIRAMADAGMMIFVRSVYLQGLVFLTPETLDPRMDFALPYLNKFIDLCKEFEMSPAVLALSFVLSLDGVSAAVLGVQTTEQMEQNCALIDSVRKLTPTQMNKLHEAFRGIDPRVINPGCWFNRF
ncbi:MAG: aldo/keto reductase [Ruminococcaceae bacterium]|nr:aldo/keto reductase [Oscillospiraceae bacterium]